MMHSNNGGVQHQQPQQHVISETEMKIACQNALDAVRQNDAKKVKRYLMKYAGHVSKVFTMSGTDGWSPVTSAADFGYTEMLRMMSHAGVPLHWADDHGWLALQAAVFQGHIDLVRFLVEEVKVNVDHRTLTGWTALHVAVRSKLGLADIVNILLHEGRADVNVSGAQGWTALHLATAEGRADLVALLLAGPETVDVDKRTDHGATPLYVASQNGHSRLLQVMSFNMNSTLLCQADGWAPIHIAAACGHDQVVSALLEESFTIDLRTSGSGGETPIYLAVEHGHASVVTKLIHHGADVSLTTRDSGWTPMMAACARGRTAIVRMLKARSAAKLDVETTSGETTLYLAAAGNHRDVVKELLEGSCPVDVDVPNSDGQTALFAAVRHNSTDVIDLLLAAGAEICTRDTPLHRTALHYAARDNNATAVQRLIDVALSTNRAELIETADVEGSTPVHAAARHGAREALSALRAAGAQLDRRNKHGRTPVFLAAHAGHKKVVDLLLHLGAQANLSESLRWTPLHAAAGSGHLEIVESLIKAGADIDCRATEDTTPTYLAAYSGHSDIATLLLAAGAKMNAQTADGWGLMHACAETGNLDLARLLLSGVYGVPNLLATSRTGDTPLHVAARWGFADIVELLIKHLRQESRADDDQEDDESKSNPNVDEPNDVGYSPLRLAVRFGHAEAAKSLLDAGADPRQTSDSGGVSTQCLHIAARSGNARIVRLLLAADELRYGEPPSSVNMADGEGWTPLHWAAAYGHTEALVALLGAANVDVEVPVSTVANAPEAGDRALHLAARGGHEAAARQLIERGGAELNSTGADGLTPMGIAMANESRGIVDVLAQTGASDLAKRK